MSALNKVVNDHQPDWVYYDVVVSNFQSTITKPQDFYYNDTRTQPFVSNPEMYALSILRFTLDTNLVPLFIPTIQPNQSDPNLTIYSVTLTYKTFTVQQFIEWEAQDNSAPVPPAPNQTLNLVQDNSQGYYNCYSYNWWVYLVYKAYNLAHTYLISLAIGADPSDPVVDSYAPLITWDGSSSSSVIYAQQEWYDVAQGDTIGMFMNAPLFSQFSSFPAKVNGYVGVLYGENFQLLPTNIGGANLVPITPAGETVSYQAIQFFQEYSTTASWSPIVSIVFTSSTLPIEPNQVSTPLVYNNGILLSTSNNNMISNIITDLVSETGNYRPNLVYLPSAQNRYIHLYGNRPLINLDLQIFYKIRTGELIPLKLNSGGSATVKLVFAKKSVLGKQ